MLNVMFLVLELPYSFARDTKLYTCMQKFVIGFEDTMRGVRR